MLVDCFLFYNEMDMLHLHLEELYDTVDKFIIVESTTTFIGNKKKLFYELNKDRYVKYTDKIVHVIVSDTPETNNPWVAERFQRNAIDNGLSKLKLNDEDLIIIGDVDEIPDTSTLTKIKNDGLKRPINLEMDFYYYNFNCRNVNKWYSSKVVPYTVYKQFPCPDRIRSSKCDSIKNGGWHLSYFGTPEFISNKLSNFSHQEFNNSNYNDIKIINDRMKRGDDLFGRSDSKFEYVESTYLPNNYLLIS